MVKYTDIKIVYDSPAFPPEPLKMNKTYTIIKKKNALLVKSANDETELDESTIKMLFSPQDEKVSWENVDFKDEIKLTDKVTGNKLV